MHPARPGHLIAAPDIVKVDPVWTSNEATFAPSQTRTQAPVPRALYSGEMADLESVTITYLEGAEEFLNRRDESLVIDIRPEGVFASGVNISAQQEVRHHQEQRRRQGHRHGFRRAAMWLVRSKPITMAYVCLCLAWVLLVIHALTSVEQRADSSAYRDPRKTELGNMSSATFTVFPLATSLSTLMADTVRLATDVSFLGISAHQVHRLLPDGANGSEEHQFERLWHGSLFNSATQPVLDSLCFSVTNYGVPNRDWQRPANLPEDLAKKELLRLCHLARVSLLEADQAWHVARVAVGELVPRVTQRCKSLAVTFSDGESHRVSDGKYQPPPPLQPSQGPTYRRAGGWPSESWAHSDYSDPAWQCWVVDSTLATLFPQATPLDLTGNIRSTISTLSHASAVALFYLHAVENATSSWVYGASSYESSRCFRGRFLPRLLCLCSGAKGEPEEIQTVRRLIQLMRRLNGYVALAHERVETTAQLASETLSGWDELQHGLQAIQDGHLHELKAQPDSSADPEALGQTRTTTAWWIFETPGALGLAVSAASVTAEQMWQSVCAYEQILWGEDQ